jgi:hypothetical protein
LQRHRQIELGDEADGEGEAGCLPDTEALKFCGEVVAAGKESRDAVLTVGFSHRGPNGSGLDVA